MTPATRWDLPRLIYHLEKDDERVKVMAYGSLSLAAVVSVVALLRFVR